ncbi:MAG: hypothetical protein ACKPKO_23895, partial [Candidatus Fonsibacter sp.]
MGADANTRLGSVTSETVGCHATDMPCYAGGLFHLIAENNDSFVPSTFSEHHEGDLDATLSRRG